MSITHASNDFGLTVHGIPQPGQWDAALSRHSWFGVVGELTLVGKNHGRTLELQAHLTGFASMSAILTQLNTLQTYRGNFGDLVVDIGGGDSTTYTKCTLESVEPTEVPWLDASGVNGWNCSIKLMWRQSNDGN